MHRARAATVVHLPCECSPGKDHAGRPGVWGGGAVKGATLWRREVGGMAGRTGLPACGGCRGDWASYSSSGQLRERHLGGRQRGPSSRAFSGSHPQTIFRARNDDRESREGHEVDVHDHRGICERGGGRGRARSSLLRRSPRGGWRRSAWQRARASRAWRSLEWSRSPAGSATTQAAGCGASGGSRGRACRLTR